jgi:Domain of unknown function (DUF4404)
MDQHIRKTLMELQAQLRHTESLPEGDREIADEIYEEIETLLARPPHERPAPLNTLLARLDDASHRFEVSHPDLTGVIARVIDSLSTMGI